MKFDPQSDDIRKRDKRVMAVHEASHAFVGGALALWIESVQLSMNPNGGFEEKHWRGSTTWSDHFEQCVDILPPDIVKEEAMKLRLFSLAGYVGECMYISDSDDAPPEADDILDWLNIGTESLSESDQRVFVKTGVSPTVREVEALMHLLAEGRDIVLEIAGRLEVEEVLDRDTLDELLSCRVYIPNGADLLDLSSWKIYYR